MTNIEQRPVADLAPHAKVKHLLGRWDNSSDAAKALRRSIQERGILQPLLVTPEGAIMDGVTRWKAAKALQLESVPCIVRGEEEAIEICLESELNRRHRTPSQRAFVFAPMIAEAFEERKKRRLEAGTGNLKVGAQVPIANSIRNWGKRVEEYASELDVSVRLLEQSRELHTLFDKYESDTWSFLPEGLEKIGRKPLEELTLREYFTAHILDEHDPMSLGGALAGAKQKLNQAMWEKQGRKHGGGKPEEPAKQLTLFNLTFKDLENRFEYWNSFDEEQREAAVKVVAVAVAKAPEDFLKKLAQKIRAEMKARKKDRK